MLIKQKRRYAIMKIEEVRLYLDENIPEYMDGIIRCGLCEVVYDNGHTEYDDTVVDNTEYHSEDEMKNDIAKRLDISPDVVEIL